MSVLIILLLLLSGCSHVKQERLKKEKPAYVKSVRNERRKLLVVIDAGHGGDDFGTHTLSKPKTHEKNLNLVTARMVNQYLQNLGYRTIMTRNDDRFISLKERAANANAYRAHLFVSVHYNSASSKQAEGVEVYYYRSEKNKVRTAESKQLAERVLDQVIKTTNANSRGIKHGNFAVIRETQMAAILIEGGFLTNESEAFMLKDPVYLKRVAQGIARGIHDFLKVRSQ